MIGAGRMLESAERALQNDLLISKEEKAENRQESTAAVEKETKCYKAYLPDDVIQIVSKHPEWKQAVILYSGDTGFFSGASRMAERLREAGYPFIRLSGYILCQLSGGTPGDALGRCDDLFRTWKRIVCRSGDETSV